MDESNIDSHIRLRPNEELKILIHGFKEDAFSIFSTNVRNGKHDSSFRMQIFPHFRRFLYSIQLFS